MEDDLTYQQKEAQIDKEDKHKYSQKCIQKSLQIPFTAQQLEEAIQSFPTPFHIYNEKSIINNGCELNQHFNWLKVKFNSSYKQYFAVKANPNYRILKSLQKHCGFGVDCSSYSELCLCERAGFAGKDIMFTANNVTEAEYAKAMQLGAVLNLDDVQNIAVISAIADRINQPFPQTMCLRYNLQNNNTYDNNETIIKQNRIIGQNDAVKFGNTKQQIINGYKKLQEKGVQELGLHCMNISNELNESSFINLAEALFQFIRELQIYHGVIISFVNLGGGIGIPYDPSQKMPNLAVISAGIQQKYHEIIYSNSLIRNTEQEIKNNVNDDQQIKNNIQIQMKDRNNTPLRIYTEYGRIITGPYGCLVTKVLNIKNSSRTFVGVDASMANLMRPAIYNAYHHITPLRLMQNPAMLRRSDIDSKVMVYDVVGSVCENIDKFAVQREMPEIQVNDFLVIQDTGAHGHAMGFNYNGKLRSAEIMLKADDGGLCVIRRAETINDYLSTLIFD